MRASQLIFLIHYASSPHGQLARGPRRKITHIAYTFDSKSTWWIGCLPGSSQTCLLPPLAYQIKPPFLSSPSLFFLFPIFTLIACSRVDRNRLWHFVTWQLGKIMLRLHHPASTPTAECPSGPCERVPLDGLSLQVLGARLPPCLHSQVFNSDLPASNLQKYN